MWTFSYDQSLPTNGFHPLWQWLLAIIAQLLPGTSIRSTLVISCFLFSAVFLAAGLFVIVKLTSPYFRASSVLLSFLPLGVFGAIIFPFYPMAATAWSQVNGLETGLSLLTLSCMFLLVYRRNSALKAGLLLSLLVLCRLDTVFLAGIYLCVEFVAGFLHSYKIRNRTSAFTFKAGAVLTLVISLYLSHNLYYSGMMAPVSGRIKSTFPTMSSMNIDALIEVVQKGNHYPDFGRFSRLRITQLFLMPLFALSYLVLVILRINRNWGRLKQFVGDSRGCRFRRLMISLALFVIVYHNYNIWFVYLEHQGQWYYYLSQIIVTLCAIHALSYCKSVMVVLSRPRYQAAVCFFFCVTAMSIYVLLYGNTSTRRAASYETFLDTSNIQNHYQKMPSLIEFDDGIIAFSTGAPCISGLGLCADKQTAAAIQSGKLMEHAQQRGFDRIASCYYLKLPAGVAIGDEVTTHFVRRKWPVDFSQFRWFVDYVPRNNAYMILRFTKVQH